MSCSPGSKEAVSQQHGKATAELSMSSRLLRLCRSFPAAANQLWVLYRLYRMFVLYTVAESYPMEGFPCSPVCAPCDLHYSTLPSR